MISEVGVTITGHKFHKFNSPLPGSVFHNYNRTLCHFGWSCTTKPLEECLTANMTPCKKCFTVMERIEIAQLVAKKAGLSNGPYLLTDAPMQITASPIVTYNVTDKPSSAIDIGR